MKFHTLKEIELVELYAQYHVVVGDGSNPLTILLLMFSQKRYGPFRPNTPVFPLRVVGLTQAVIVMPGWPTLRLEV